MTTSRSRAPDQDRKRGHDRPPRVPDGDGPHPSFLALDRAALGSRTAGISEHLADCARCRLHVERIADPGPAPALGRLPREVPRPVRRRPRMAWFNGLTAAAAAAVLLLVVLVGRERPEMDPTEPVRARPPADTAHDTVKGGRAVGVYVLRGRHTFLWNGTEPVIPGDTIRLKLVPDGMTQVHVFSPGSSAAELTLLHRATIAPDRDALLDAAWKVDGAGDREVLIVLLSSRPLSLARAQDAARTGGMGDTLWVARLILPKRRAPRSEVLP
jgi:hypothetical protein